jgi:aspartate carbamoyltransferase regulatory subunit
MPDRTARQQATVTTMIDIAAQMAMQTKRIARRDVVEVGEVELTDEEIAKLSDARLHIEKAVKDLRRLRGAT